MFLYAHETAQPADLSNIIVLVVSCVISGCIVGIFVSMGIYVGVRDRFTSPHHLPREHRHMHGDEEQGMTNTAGSRGMPVTSGFELVAVSPMSASLSITGHPGHVSARPSAAHEPTVVQDSGGRSGSPERSSVLGSAHSSVPSSARSSVRGEAHAIATVSDVGFWDGSVVPWGIIAASATPCVSSVFEDDTEDEAEDGHVNAEDTQALSA